MSMEPTADQQMEQIRRGDYQTIREVVFRYLRDSILSGQYEYGERLIESELAQKFGVSRTPIREAFRKLELEGLVKSLSRRGVIVTSLSHRDLDEIYSIRSVLEGLAARLAAERRTTEQVEELDTLLRDMDEAMRLGHYEEFAKIHNQFNQTLYSISGNKQLEQILSRFQDYNAKSQIISMSRPGRPKAIQEEHRRIVQCIADQMPEEAERAARDHVEKARKAFFESGQGNLAGV